MWKAFVTNVTSLFHLGDKLKIKGENINMMFSPFKFY